MPTPERVNARIITNEDLADIERHFAAEAQARILALETERDLLLRQVERLAADNDAARAEARAARAELRAAHVDSLVEVLP